MSDDFDTDAFIVLANTGIDPLTAAAGSIVDRPRPSPKSKPGLALYIVIAIGLAAGVWIASSL